MKQLLATTLLLLFLSSGLHAQGQESLGEALRLRDQGSLEAAVALLAQIAQNKNYPLHDYAQFEIGEINFQAGRYAEAISQYYKLITQHQKSILIPKAYLQIGKCYFNLKNFTSAIKTFKYYLKRYSETKEAPEASFLIGKSYQLQDKLKESYLAFEETDLYYPHTFFGSKAREAMKILRKKYRRKIAHLKPSADMLFKKGMFYFDQEEYETAAYLFSRLAREFPKSKYIKEAWLMLGQAELKTKQDLSSAISNLEKATSGPPNLAGKAHYYLGLAYGRKGQYDQAIASFQKVIDFYPESDLADEANYWLAYYQELKGEKEKALLSYYHLIKSFPYSKSVPAAIWRMGRMYYWAGDFKNAATYLHLAQLYPPQEDTPRCYFFEAKALERLGNRAAALEVYKKLCARFDHAYYAYRAQEKINSYGLSFSFSTPFHPEDFNQALVSIDNGEELAAIMEIWEKTNYENLSEENSEEAQAHLKKYKELLSLNLINYAAEEARYLVNITSEKEKEPLQTKLAETLFHLGNYRAPIRFAERKIKSAIFNGTTATLPPKIWRLSYPKGYWKQVLSNAQLFDLDPYLVLAVIREESRFNPKATSRSNAKGLMQIIPSTGRGIARKLNLSHYRSKKLYDAKLNIKMGTYYLSNLIKSFQNNAYLALAGYNGGPNRVKNYLKLWYNNNLKVVDIDEFIESIPIRETRLYVQKVMGSYFEYKRLYEGKRG